MRARQGLGLVLLAMGRYDEAIAEFKELLERNSNDNQGIRYLVAPIFLAQGQVKNALKEYQWYDNHYKNDIPDPHYLLSWGLALYLDRQYEKAAIKFRATLFANPYLVPVLLGKKPNMLPIWHSCNLTELDYALDYLKDWPMLWINQTGACGFLNFIWEDSEMEGDRSEWVDYWSKLKKNDNISQRRRIIDLSEKLERKAPSPQFFKRLTQFLEQKK
jgi:tetratricopeptide (TPR) repeat protein